MPQQALPAADLRGRAPAGLDAGHVRQLVRDALVAIDAGPLAVYEKARVDFGRAPRLPGEIHRDRRVAIAAFQRIVGLQPRPFVFRKLEAVIEEFLARVDRAKDLAPDLL